jgi:hypothetical protein
MKHLFRVAIFTNGFKAAEFTVKLSSSEIDGYIQPIRDANPQSNVNWYNDATDAFYCGMSIEDEKDYLIK